MTTIPLLGVSIWAVTLPLQARAQLLVDPQDPVSVARAVISADSAQDWGILLQFTHPDALKRFRESQLEFMRMDEDPAFRTISETPGPSKLVRFMLDSVYRVKDLRELEALAPESLLVRFMSMPGMREPAAQFYLARMARLLPGVVLDGDSVAYVIIRRPPILGPDDELESPSEHMTLRRYTFGWRSMLDGGLLFSDSGFSFGFIEDDE